MSTSPVISTDPWTDADAVEQILDRTADRHAATIERHPVLSERLETHIPDAWRAFSEIYGAGATAAEWFLRAVTATLEGFEERPERLRRRDRARAEDLEWFQTPEQLGYMCYVDRFAGTLEGVREKIPYLNELGVTYLHLMPLLEAREGRNDGGYAVKDYRSVDPRLGTMDDLRTLAKDLHENDILLATDVVMNHTAREHEWAQAARDGDERFRDFYLTFEDRTAPDRYEETVPEVFPDFAPGNFTYVDAMDRWVWTSFNNFQWDLDFGNPDVFVQMLRELLFQANVGTDVLRLDAVPFLWKETGTNCRNHRNAHKLLRAYRALVRIAAPGVLFKAEAIVEPEEIIRYLGTGAYEGKECDVAYNATLMCHLWHALASEHTQLLRTALTNLPPAPASATWLNYVRCHDDIGWGLDDEDVQSVGQDPSMTRQFCANFYAGRSADSSAEGYHFQIDEDTGEARTCGTTAALSGLQKAMVEGDADDVEEALQRTLLMHNVIFVARGMPLLYSGDEIAQFNDFSFLKDETKANDNRWVHRPPMDWEKAALRTEEGRLEQRVFDGLKHFAETRKEITALHGGGRERILSVDNDQVFAIERTHDDDRLLSVSNFSDQSQAVSLARLPPAWDTRTVTDVLRGESVHFSSGRVLLPPYGYAWFQPADEGAPSGTVATHVDLEVHTEWGEEVYLCGNLEELGAGDPRYAHGPLSADNYPRWSTEVQIPAGTYFEFHWIKKRDGRVVEWSPVRYGMRAGASEVWPLEATR